MGDDLEWCDRWKIQRSRQGVGAARSEAVRSREQASPADLHCQDERLLSVGAEASNSRLLLHPFPHPPLSLRFFLWLSWLSPQYDIVLPLHVYPVAMVTQCRGCHSKITQGGIHRSPEFSFLPVLCFPHTDLIYLFPRSSARIQIICNIIEMEEE